MKTIGNKGLYEIAHKLNNHNAEAKTIIGYAKNRNNIRFFEGSCKGKIISPKGNKGFGWDPVFQPKGYKKSFAQMSPQEKNKISMRRKALNKLKRHLAKL
jgi:non-canonical purine NTP pyrophosphatase (RdgB/HAM1 family)